MFKEKRNRLKVVMGTIVLILVFTGFYSGVNSVAFNMAADNQESLYEGELQVIEDEAALCEVELLEAGVSLWDMTECELYYYGLLDWIEYCDWVPGMECEIFLEDDTEWKRLTTPEERHMSEAEALALGIAWIYEEFGLVVDLARDDQFIAMLFEHEDMGVVRHSFWQGIFSIWECGGYCVYGVEASGGDLDSIYFVLDGITGERVTIANASCREFDDFIGAEVIFYRNMEITVVNNNHPILEKIVSPSFAVPRQPYYLPEAEVAMQVAEMIYERYHVNLDQHFMYITLGQWDMEYALYPIWHVQIMSDCIDGEEWDWLFALDVHAVTGELLGEIIDIRGIVFD